MQMNDFTAIVPVVIVVLSACAVMLAEAFRRKHEDMPMGLLALIGLGGAMASSILLWNRHLVGFGVVSADNFALFFNVTICGVGILTVLLSMGPAERDGLPVGEYYTLMLFSVAGMMLMGSSKDLLVIFLALEIMSLGVYVLTA
ncbi:MAG: hypothetical protein JF610_13905, partial [Acidobacteria bacterium]|nr:hypothetical protein [Acidobacteriota bacterium]